MSWVIRDYRKEDLHGCVQVLESNLPDYFAEHERDEFIDDLQSRERLSEDKQWPYFVLATGSRILGCAGYCVDQQYTATLIWGMVTREAHGQGLGQALLNYRVLHMLGKVRKVALDTTPRSFGFYQKQGFVRTGFVENGYGEGLDKILAQLDLTVK